MKEILLIILLQLLFVPTLTLRTIFLVKGKIMFASLFGIFETLIYVFGLSLVLKDQASVLSMVVYAVGFGLGIQVGGFIERKLAIGYVTLQVNTLEKNQTLIDELRESGFGVTVFAGEGRDGARYRMDILTKRNAIERAKKIIDYYDEKAFIIVYEPIDFKGGYLVKSMKKHLQNKA